MSWLCLLVCFTATRFAPDSSLLCSPETPLAFLYELNTVCVIILLLLLAVGWGRL